MTVVIFAFFISIGLIPQAVLALWGSRGGIPSSEDLEKLASAATAEAPRRHRGATAEPPRSHRGATATSVHRQVCCSCGIALLDFYWLTD